MIKELFKEHLTNIGIKPDALEEIFSDENETLSEEQQTIIKNALGSTMTTQVAIADRNVRNAVIKDVMTNTENSIFDHLISTGVVNEDFTKTLAEKKKLSEKMKLTVDHILSSNTGDKGAEKLKAEISDLKAQLASGSNSTTKRVEALNQQIENLTGQLSEKDKTIQSQNSQFEDWKITTFLQSQLNGIPLADNGDPSYRAFIQNTIINDAKKKAKWVSGESGIYNPMQTDNENLPLYGKDQTNPISGFNFLQSIALPYIDKAAGTGRSSGSGSGGSGGNADLPETAGMTPEQKTRYLKSIGAVHKD